MTTFHFGVLAHEGRTDITRIFPRGIAISSNNTKFETGFDSFTEWGESLGDDSHPAHVTCELDDDPDMSHWKKRTLVIDLMAELGSLLDVETYRVIDYVVFTDTEDWSLNPNVIGAYA